MFKKIISLSLITILVVSPIVVHQVYARSLNDYESAAFLAKIPEVKIETGLIATHAGDKDAINYYTHLLNQYWTIDDTELLKERNPELADLISSTINDTITNAMAGDYDKAYSDYFSLAGYMEEVGAVRVDFPNSINSTIRALSIVNVLNESLARYGDAINVPMDIDFSSTNASKIQSVSGVTSGPQKIVNKYAYENSKELAHESLLMFGHLIEYTSEKHTFNDKILSYMEKYLSDLNVAADPNTIVTDVQVNIYSNFVATYGLQSIPEFPFPALMEVVMIGLVITISKLEFKKRGI